MDFEWLPFDGEPVFGGEAVDTRLAKKTPRSYEVGIDGHAWGHDVIIAR